MALHSNPKAHATARLLRLAVRALEAQRLALTPLENAFAAGARGGDCTKAHAEYCRVVEALRYFEGEIARLTALSPVEISADLELCEP